MSIMKHFPEEIHCYLWLTYQQRILNELDYHLTQVALRDMLWNTLFSLMFSPAVVLVNPSTVFPEPCRKCFNGEFLWHFKARNVLWREISKL